MGVQQEAKMSVQELWEALGFSDDFALDDDILKMQLSDAEKIGLQINRDFNRKIEKHRTQKLRDEIESENFSTDNLEKLVKILEQEDARALPVVFCAYLDDVLLAMFKREVPDGVPGGKASLFNAFGPFSDFASRLKIAYCFGLISAALLIDIDHVRKIRNEISHTWDIDQLSEFFSRSPLKDIVEIEKLIAQSEVSKKRGRLAEDFCDTLRPLQIFRIRLVWLACRTSYEARYFYRTQKERLDPYRTLYLDHGTKWLTQVSGIAFSATERIANSR
jgi:DNA-binding MltR family transcriptional regulator